MEFLTNSKGFLHKSTIAEDWTIKQKRVFKKQDDVILSLSKYFQLTDNQYRFRQAQPDKSNYEDILDTLF